MNDYEKITRARYQQLVKMMKFIGAEVEYISFNSLKYVVGLNGIRCELFKKGNCGNGKYFYREITY